MLKSKSIITFALAIALPTTVVSVFAEETAGEKVQAEGRDAKVKTKKNWRKTKKKVRDATGNSSMKEDTKDAAKNVGDSIDNTAKTVKNKVD
jgi:hypothetical protein